MEDTEQIRIKKEKLKTHPRSKANFLSHFFFCWELPIIVKGWRKEITEDDLYTPLKDYEAKSLGDQLEQIWSDEKYFSKKPSLWRCLVKLFGCKFLLYGILYLPGELAVTILQPFFLQKLLDFYTPNQTKITKNQAYLYAAGLSFIAFIRVICIHTFLFATTVTGMKARIACTSLIYRSALTMKKESIDKFTMGQLVNILSNDLTRFEQVAPYLHFLWIGTIEFIIGSFYIDYTLGHAALAGGLSVFLCLIFQIYVSLKLSKSRSEIATKTDYRIRLMNDIISGIEAMKMYTWEKPFAKLVELARRLELDKITIASHFRLFNNAFKIYMGKFCVFLSVLTMVLTYQPLTSQFVYVLVSMYESFKLTVIYFLPLGVMMFAETNISIRRIEEFLLHDYEKPKNLIKSMEIASKDVCILRSHHENEKKFPRVSLKNVTVKWNKSFDNNALDKINFEANLGMLVGVMGSAGSGKSTLLHVILKELEVVRGKVECEGRLSYTSQEAWIFPTSIKQNIIFGEEYNVEKYTKVVKVCALERDLTLFPHGDQTLVGERGMMLSGGQKARINLARAVYRDADIYLLDDPLSAVDAHVARHIFDECIKGYLKTKCVILVTHQIHYLQKADIIYELKLGKIIKSGKYEDVVGVKDQHVENIPTETPSVVPLKVYDLREEIREHRSTGSSNAKVYKSYCFAAGHWCFTILVLFLFALGQILLSLLDSFLTFWTNIEQKAIHLTSYFSKLLTRENSLYIYVALTVAAVLVIHLATFVFTLFCMKASKHLHNNMLYKVVHGTMNFFNHNPSGRLLNRFSKDLGCIDELLPLYLMNLITVICTGAAIMCIIVAVNYWMTLPSLILVSFIAFFVVMFQPTNRNIKRTEGTTRSSVFTHMSTTLQGLVTIRAHNSQIKLIQEFDDHQDLHSSAFYLFTATFAAFGFWADFMSAAYTVLVVFSFFILGPNAYVASVGFAITQSINLLGMVQYGVKTWGELDSHMTSVERVVEYAELDPEPDEGTESPPDYWPNEGNILFKSVSLKYENDDPPVLKNVSFEVKSGEKIGIIGRTGAGKTSLISVLFRLFHFDGTVIIDGIDTKSISLNSLRSKISIIPQDPVLFIGTLRKNVDPFNDYSDSQLWKTLEELDLKQMISSHPFGLETPVSERGSNFSVGQRQLLCLLRALLRNSKIIVMDEATANVDLKTDELIQKLIRKKFKNCTVLTIAHRLNTVIDSDKILAMDGGRVVEFDHPYNLLQNSNGFFYSFVKRNGDRILQEFIKVTKKSAEKKAKEVKN